MLWCETMVRPCRSLILAVQCNPHQNFPLTIQFCFSVLVCIHVHQKMGKGLLHVHKQWRFKKHYVNKWECQPFFLYHKIGIIIIIIIQGFARLSGWVGRWHLRQLLCQSNSLALPSDSSTTSGQQYEWMVLESHEKSVPHQGWIRTDSLNSKHNYQYRPANGTNLFLVCCCLTSTAFLYLLVLFFLFSQVDDNSKILPHGHKTETPKIKIPLSSSMWVFQP